VCEQASPSARFSKVTGADGISVPAGLELGAGEEPVEVARGWGKKLLNRNTTK